ncbi:response regulator transcription factor [Humibacillus xanthopallidus]|uniref:response regulator transcription factor n=1 Tax=Humibacillus xanthopallidus TaxID=412689 RepID=UPI00384C83BC
MDEHTRWIRAASEILNAPTPQRAHDLLVDELMRETHADVATRVGLSPQDPQAIAISVEAREKLPPREHWPVAAQARAHPLAQYYGTTTDHSPVRLTDLIEAGWTLDDDAHDAMAALGITVHQMTVPCDTHRGDFDGWVVLNEGGFGSEDLARLTDLHTLLVGLDRHIRLFTAAVGMGVPDPGDAPSLTPRERLVLSLLASGSTAEGVAARLMISPRTVHKHQEHLYRKLGACDRLSAVLAAQRLGLLPAGGSGRAASLSAHPHPDRRYSSGSSQSGAHSAIPSTTAIVSMPKSSSER